VPAADYTTRLNRAIDHIVANLAAPLQLQDVAAAAALSPFHFHRVFAALMGETLNNFVRRVRLERALFLMAHTPRRALTDIALQCGFASLSDFSRSFKQRHGVAPSAFDLKAFRSQRRVEFERVLFDAPRPQAPASDASRATHNPDGFSVELIDLPARTAAYIRVFDPYREDVVQAATQRLWAWAEARGLQGGQWLGYMWDEPETVAMAQCRYDAAVVVPKPFKGSGEVGCFQFAAMRVAQVQVRGSLALEARAFDWLYQSWLPSSGYVPDEQPAFEAWRGKPYAHGAEWVELVCQLPVRLAYSN
jgi:AraC family transcriptional regulator